MRILTEGRDVALITDAGTPAISDPGVDLVAAARERGVPIVTIPGPTAVAASLAVCGIPADRYLFLGFLPRKGSDRRRLLSTAAASEWTVVMFEAPNRVTQLLADLAEVCGPERQAAVSRELTKVFEETRAGTLQELSAHYAEAPVRGEVTVVLSGTGKQRVEEPPPDAGERAKALLAEGLSRKDVAHRLAEETGISRNTAYKLVSEL
ncbi:MAG: 16S rRNA (cytidine(1402)-2'-O)-methyltransferase [Gemmatimonadetes bacterium]|nr:MAG: 16S rRNA (cytidine(1402)-2'-O)-methyltransferase [Gemmatimonadota bacterium]